MAAKISKKTKGQASGGKASAQKVTSSARAQLTFPPAKFQRLLRRGRHSRRVSPTAGIFLAGCLEWLTQEILECMMQAAQKSKSSMLHPRHVMGAILGDEELSVVFNNVVIMKGGMGSSSLGIESCFGGGGKSGKKKSKKGLPTNRAETSVERSEEADEEMEEASDKEDAGEEDDASSDEAHSRNHNDSQEF